MNMDLLAAAALSLVHFVPAPLLSQCQPFDEAVVHAQEVRGFKAAVYMSVLIGGERMAVVISPEKDLLVLIERAIDGCTIIPAQGREWTRHR